MFGKSIKYFIQSAILFAATLALLIFITKRNGLLQMKDVEELNDTVTFEKVTTFAENDSFTLLYKGLVVNYPAETPVHKCSLELLFFSDDSKAIKRLMKFRYYNVNYFQKTLTDFAPDGKIADETLPVIKKDVVATINRMHAIDDNLKIDIKGMVCE